MIIGDIASVVSCAKDVAELSATDKAKIWFKKVFGKRIKIAVYGDSGVGKTQFLRTMTGKNNYLNVHDRTRNIERHKMTLRTGRKILLIDMPGHASNKDSRDPVLNEITRGKIDGLLNIVNYGYQDSELLQQNPSTVFKVGSSEVKPEFLRENRKREIQRTQEFVDRIGPDVKLKWIITVINKADIWHKEKKDVEEYYKNGDYYKAIQSLKKVCILESRCFCSVITPFGNRDMTLSYSEQDKYSDFNSLISLIEEIIG